MTINEYLDPVFENGFFLINQIFSGARIYAHDDSKQDNNKITTNYLCGHVFRITSELKSQSLKYTGFIHIAKEPEEKHFFDVLAIVVRGFIEKLYNQESISIMITGFTQFKHILDNPTGRFLFGDGISTNPESYGIKNPQVSKIDKMMFDHFSISNSKPFYHKNNLNLEIGRSYIYNNPKDNRIIAINLIFVRLPVDEDMTTDRTGYILKSSINEIKPNAIISFGAGTDGKENYNIETISYGMKDKGAVYLTKESYIYNDDIVNIYREQLKK